jgi:ATP-dependent Lon protease
MKQELSEDSSDKNDEFTELREKLVAKHLPHDSEKEAMKQLGRLERMHPDSSEASILRSYLEWVVDLPWSEESKEVTDLNFAKDVLDEDHFDLEKIKERILEFIKDRIFERYIYPVENVPIEFKNGFNMMANACLSIEAFMKIYK